MLENKIKGVGIFEGTRQQVVDGELHDFMELRYAEGNRLLVPVDKIRLVQRYSVSENEKPPLDKLGSRKWLNRKRRSQKKIREMAEDLLKLYAQRAAGEGSACAGRWPSSARPRFCRSSTGRRCASASPSTR